MKIIISILALSFVHFTYANNSLRIKAAQWEPNNFNCSETELNRSIKPNSTCKCERVHKTMGLQEEYFSCKQRSKVKACAYPCGKNFSSCFLKEDLGTIYDRGIMSRDHECHAWREKQKEEKERAQEAKRLANLNASGEQYTNELAQYLYGNWEPNKQNCRDSNLHNETKPHEVYQCTLLRNSKPEKIKLVRNAEKCRGQTSMMKTLYHEDYSVLRAERCEEWKEGKEADKFQMAQIKAGKQQCRNMQASLNTYRSSNSNTRLSVNEIRGKIVNTNEQTDKIKLQMSYDEDKLKEQFDDFRNKTYQALNQYQDILLSDLGQEEADEFTEEGGIGYLIAEEFIALKEYELQQREACDERYKNHARARMDCSMEGWKVARQDRDQYYDDLYLQNLKFENISDTFHTNMQSTKEREFTNLFREEVSRCRNREIGETFQMPACKLHVVSETNKACSAYAGNCPAQNGVASEIEKELGNDLAAIHSKRWKSKQELDRLYQQLDDFQNRDDLSPKSKRKLAKLTESMKNKRKRFERKYYGEKGITEEGALGGALASYQDKQLRRFDKINKLEDAINSEVDRDPARHLVERWKVANNLCCEGASRLKNLAFADVAKNNQLGSDRFCSDVNKYVRNPSIAQFMFLPGEIEDDSMVAGSGEATR